MLEKQETAPMRRENDRRAETETSDQAELPLVDLQVDAAGVLLRLCQDFLKDKKEESVTTSAPSLS